MKMTIPMLLREINTQGRFEHNYFIAPKVGIGVRCFVGEAEILPDLSLGYIVDHLTGLKIHNYKCYLDSSLN